MTCHPVRSTTLPQSLHVVEPTLKDDRGHTRALVLRFCAALEGRQVDVWASRKAIPAAVKIEGVRLRRWFWRRVRTVQLFFLMRRLLGQGGTVFLPTAGRTAIMFADWASRWGRPEGEAVLYVHWLRPTARRMKSLATVARRSPELRLLTTTETVRDLLSSCGFRNVRHVPYPAELQVALEAPPSGFRWLLYAGAARRDKGFHRVVDLIEHLAASDAGLPVRIHAVGDYFDRLDTSVLEDIARLRATDYAPLGIEEATLTEGAFRAMFAGAICLQLYDPEEFADRVSGITLDALAAGAPIVAHRGTWIARHVEAFDAGRVVAPGDLEGLVDAIREIEGDYGRFSAAARQGATVLAERHHPRHLVRAVLG